MHPDNDIQILRREDRPKPRMDVKSAPGTKILLDAQGGHLNEQMRALQLLKLGETYTVSAIHLGDGWSQVKIVEYNGLWFNTLLFAAIKAR